MGLLTSKSKVILQDDLLKSRIEYQSNLIDKVLEKKKFHLYSVTEFGNFGPTINIKYSLLENEYAVKILQQENIGPEELQWYQLYNENIHSLITIEFVENVDVFLFYTEAWNYSLKEIMEQKLLKKRQDGMTMALKWVKEVANGLMYLHKKNLFHLNISTENIVITDNDIAKITNFHFICSRKAFNKK